MTGQPGKSGGARKGAGRKQNPENQGKTHGEAMLDATPLEVLEEMMRDAEVPIALRIAAAKAAAPFVHQKLGETGKIKIVKSRLQKSRLFSLYAKSSRLNP